MVGRLLAVGLILLVLGCLVVGAAAPPHGDHVAAMVGAGLAVALVFAALRSPRARAVDLASTPGAALALVTRLHVQPRAPAPEPLVAPLLI